MNANKKAKTTIMASYHLSKSDNETMFENHICACTFCSMCFNKQNLFKYQKMRIS